ncbi:MAG TPA: phospholipid carrier-dependent glycosyltransferase [Roseiflexaceae bacterium]|nr:phospholipid carrier-dependent glycosyltransferase [Roseiflexaceae bacterium]
MFVVATVFLVFARTFHFGLYFDDYHHARSWTLHQVLGTFAGPFDPLGIEPPYYRPLLVVTFAIDWNIWGYNALGYHLTNVLLHAIASVLVYVLLQRLHVRWWVALLGALFFAIIPANAATAIYISERSDAMIAICALSGLLCLDNYRRSGRNAWLIGVNLAVVLAVGSKEIGVAVPLLIAFFWAYHAVIDAPYLTGPRTVLSCWRAQIQHAQHTLFGQKNWQRTALIIFPPMALLALYLVYRTIVLPTGLVSQRYSTAVSPIHGYASAIFWTFKAVPWEVPSLALPWLLGAGGLAALLKPRSEHWRIVACGAGWVALSCLPLGYLGQVEPRLLYLPEVGHAIVVAGLAAILFDIVQMGWRNQKTRSLAAAGLAILLGIGFFTTTMISEVRAQDEFQPDGYKMRHAMNEIMTDLRYRDLYPAYYLKQIEQRLQNPEKDDNP